jgi:hypothetical protein
MGRKMERNSRDVLAWRLGELGREVAVRLFTCLGPEHIMVEREW